MCNWVYCGSTLIQYLPVFAAYSAVCGATLWCLQVVHWPVRRHHHLVAVQCRRYVTPSSRHCSLSVQRRRYVTPSSRRCPASPVRHTIISSLPVRHTHCQGWNEFIPLNAFNECIHEFIHLKKFNNWIIHKLFLCDYKIEDRKTAHAKKFCVSLSTKH